MTDKILTNGRPFQASYNIFICYASYVIYHAYQVLIVELIRWSSNGEWNKWKSNIADKWKAFFLLFQINEFIFINITGWCSVMACYYIRKKKCLYLCVIQNKMFECKYVQKQKTNNAKQRKLWNKVKKKKTNWTEKKSYFYGCLNLMYCNMFIYVTYYRGCGEIKVYFQWKEI